MRPEFHFEKMTPRFKGFNGEIYLKEDFISYTVKGRLNVIRDEVLITELPIRTWTRTYKTYLEEFFKDDQITDIKEFHKDNTVHFEITLGSLKGKS